MGSFPVPVCILFMWLRISVEAASPTAALSERGVGERSLLEEIAGSLTANESHRYHQAIQKDWQQLEVALLPTLSTLPRSRFGKIEPAAVRYALHRYFVAQHAWQVKGLESKGAAWNSSASPAQAVVLKRLPVSARSAIDMKLAEGFESSEVLVLAATIEQLIHSVSNQRLQATYHVVGLEEKSDAPTKQALKAIELYMASYILGADIGKTPRDRLLDAFSKIEETYPSWNETRHFIHNVTERQIAQHPSDRKDYMSFDVLKDIVEELDDTYGKWQNRECLALKDQLVKLEDHGTGRVRLANFYNKALGGGWQFTESVPYLRKNGALDETNPSNLRVIIPNYVNSLSNCIGASRYHNMCCISECEALMVAVERGAGKPEVYPEEVIDLISALPSATVRSNRTLPDLLKVRLRAIALEHDNGRVPIHGRLFAQWMHHAYPRECPFPHVAGSTQPVSIYAVQGSGMDAVATDGDMRFRATDKPPSNGAPLETVPWSNEEELPFSPQAPDGFVAIHGLAASIAFAMLCAGLSRMAWLGARSRMRKTKGLVGKARGPLLEDSPTVVVV